MDYLLICISSVLFSFQFLFQRNYKEKYGSRIGASLVFSIYTAVIGAIIVFIIGFFFMNMKIEFTLFSIILATAYAMINVGFTIVSAKALDSANLALFSMFAMLGGMLIPFLFGVIFKGEPLNVKNTVGLILIAGVLAFSSLNKVEGANKRNKKSALFYYISVFVLNGVVGVVSSIHQMEKYKSLAVDSYQFSVLTKIMTLLLAVFLLIILRQKMIKVTPKIFVFTSCYSAFSSIGNLFIFIALLTLPTSVQYPIITGGTIIISNVISCVSEKKFSIKYTVCAIISLLATIMFML